MPPTTEVVCQVLKDTPKEWVGNRKVNVLPCLAGDLEELLPQISTTGRLSQWASMWCPDHRWLQASAAMTTAYSSCQVVEIPNLRSSHWWGGQDPRNKLLSGRPHIRAQQRHLYTGAYGGTQSRMAPEWVQSHSRMVGRWSTTKCQPGHPDWDAGTSGARTFSW